MLHFSGQDSGGLLIPPKLLGVDNGFDCLWCHIAPTFGAGALVSLALRGRSLHSGTIHLPMPVGGEEAGDLGPLESIFQYSKCMKTLQARPLVSEPGTHKLHALPEPHMNVQEAN